MITHFNCRCGRKHMCTDNAKHVVCICGQFIDVADCAVWDDQRQKRMDFGQSREEAYPMKRALEPQDVLTDPNVVVLTRAKADHPCGATTHPDGTVMCQQCGLSWDKDDDPPTCPNA